MLDNGQEVAQVAGTLGVGRATIYREVLISKPHEEGSRLAPPPRDVGGRRRPCHRPECQPDAREWRRIRPVATGSLTDYLPHTIRPPLDRPGFQPCHRGQLPSRRVDDDCPPFRQFGLSGGAGMPYRRRKDSDTWHWCRNCSNWPTSNYEEQQSKPSNGELDNECRSKDATGNCQK